MILIRSIAPISLSPPDRLCTLSGWIFLWSIRLLESIGCWKPHTRYPNHFSPYLSSVVFTLSGKRAELKGNTFKLIITLNRLKWFLGYQTQLMDHEVTSCYKMLLSFSIQPKQLSDISSFFTMSEPHNPSALYDIKEYWEVCFIFWKEALVKVNVYIKDSIKTVSFVFFLVLITQTEGCLWIFWNVQVYFMLERRSSEK